MIIDKAKALELLEKAVQEKGADHTSRDENGYLVCFYQRSGQPMCVVGHAYFYAGATVDQLQRMDDRGDSSIDTLYESCCGVLPVETTEEAIGVFQAAQTAQDNGNTWGEALNVAKEAAGV